MLRRAVDVVDAHQELCGAFGRVALALDPWRVFADLFTGPDQYASDQAYTVLVILFSARNPRCSIGEIPCLPTDVGLPAKRGVPSTSNWATAARIDPLAVLPFMEWWSSPGQRYRRITSRRASGSASTAFITLSRSQTPSGLV